MVTPATAAGTCSYDSGTRTLTASINPGETATLVVVGTALHFGDPAAACGGGDHDEHRPDLGQRERRDAPRP